jgi:hypothetical protein
LLKTLLALEPSVEMAVMHTTTIRANMTAYSTAVGPSSFCRNADAADERRFNMTGNLSAATARCDQLENSK